jgi:hypothetical protein
VSAEPAVDDKIVCGSCPSERTGGAGLHEDVFLQHPKFPQPGCAAGALAVCIRVSILLFLFIQSQSFYAKFLKFILL